MKNFIYFLLFFQLTSFNSFALNTSTPGLINYQGKVVTSGGHPLSGSKRIEFNIYDHPLEGNVIWGPQIFSNVPVINGLFNVILGEKDTSGRSIVNAFSTSNRYIGIKVASLNGDLSQVNEITPRQALLSVPYAIHSIHSVPVGSIMPFFGSTEPEGWVFCDGRSLDDSSLSNTKFENLKKHLQKEGLNALPDFRGRFPLGQDNMNGIDADRVTNINAKKLGGHDGAEKHTLTASELPAHSHEYYDVFHSETSNETSQYRSVPGKLGSASTDRDNVGHQIKRTTDNTGNNQPHNNMPPYCTVKFMIKY